MSNFKRGVTKVTDVFDPKTFKMMDEESCSKIECTETEWRVNKTNWSANSPYISNYGQAGTIITTPVSDTVKQLMVAAMAEHINVELCDLSTNFNHTAMFRSAFIPWHTDTHCDIAITFYFQDTDPNMGGLYLYSDTEKDESTFYLDEDVKINAISPRKNTMLLQHHCMHSVSALTPMTPVRRSIQAFVRFDR